MAVGSPDLSLVDSAGNPATDINNGHRVAWGASSGGKYFWSLITKREPAFPRSAGGRYEERESSWCARKIERGLLATPGFLRESSPCPEHPAALGTHDEETDRKPSRPREASSRAPGKGQAQATTSCRENAWSRVGRLMHRRKQANAELPPRARLRQPARKRRRVVVAMGRHLSGLDFRRYLGNTLASDDDGTISSVRAPAAGLMAGMVWGWSATVPEYKGSIMSWGLRRVESRQGGIF